MEIKMKNIAFAQRLIWSNLKKRIDLKKNYYIYISSTTNNTIISLVNNKGNVLA
jgi:ribosomal protein S11